MTPSRETLYRLYIEEGLSSIEIAQRIEGLTHNRVLLLLKRYNIPIQDNTRKIRGWNTGKTLSQEQRQRLSEFAKKRTGKRSSRYGATLGIHTRNKISNALKGRFRGKANPQYNPNAAHKYRAVWESRYEYKEWREAVYARDNYTCQLCGKPSNGDLNCHHIKTIEHHPELIVDMDNGITLCEACHRNIKGKETDYEAFFLSKIIHHPK